MSLADFKNWWSHLAPRPRSRKARRSRFGLPLYRGSLAALVVGLLTYLSPSQRPYNITELPVGSVAPERINAPFIFQVRKSKEELERERSEAERTIPTILRRHPQVKIAQLARLDSVFKVLLPNLRMQMPDSLKQHRLQRQLPRVMGSLSEAARRNLTRTLSDATPEALGNFQQASRQLLADIYTRGVIASKTELLDDITQRIRLDEQELPIDTIYSAEDLERGGLIALIKGYRVLVESTPAETIHELLNLFIEANLYIDGEETQRLRAKARGSVASIKDQYVKDEMIIDKNTRVMPEHIEALNALADKIAEQQREDPLTRSLQKVAAATVAGFFVLIFAYYLATRESLIYRSPAQLLLLAIIATATAAIASYIKNNEIHAYLIPTPLATMLATILFNPQLGLVLSFLLAFFVGGLFGDFYIALICALTSAVALYSVRQVRHRNQFYRAMIFIPLSYTLLIAATDLLRFVPPEEIYRHILPGIFIGVAAPILTIGLLPIFESLFRITTDITLLELSDLNRPLLRELAIRAPGSYTHSLIMANLSEAAAESIGANPLLARVGCYYHDIGKMLKPEYFTENQGLRGGRNPHDHLTPTMSTLIITSHVKDGLELAEEHGLPQAISDLIPQHHGTTVVEYFYNRAVELGLESVRKDDFCYDGPKPQTREAGILMLADSVESAVRSLSERTPNRVRQLVNKLIQQKFTAGELDECALTLQDLHKIEDSFIPVLMGTLHGRVEYPWQKTERKSA